MARNSVNQMVDLLDLTADVVSAYVSNNPVRASDLPDLIRNVHGVFGTLAMGAATVAPQGEIQKPTPAQIRKSVTPDGIVSFLDGKTYKTLKRHLRVHGMDAPSYRVRFGLSADYPMVAPEYAARRSALAKSIGLGRITGRDEVEQPQSRKKAA